jgi:DNA-binding response OmpR family regulator
MGTPGEILGVEDDAPMCELVAKVLGREGYAANTLPHVQAVLQALIERPADLVILRCGCQTWTS